MRFLFAITSLLFLNISFGQGKLQSFHPGQLWSDNNGSHINAHGGGVLYHDGTYYWFGESKSDTTNSAMVGVSCYTSDDLYNWKNRGTALSVSRDEKSDIVQGCIIERPKVIYNTKTKTFVMWFHLELKGQGYGAARVGVATSKKAEGPYKYIRSFRPNANIYPLNMPDLDKNISSKTVLEHWWTPAWYEAVENGIFVRRDLETGQMSRDMTLFVDDDGTAYHIYSSEENLTLHIARLTDDYMSHIGQYIRIFPGGHNEAPAIFKKDGRYFMITSGCTGWDPNAARLFAADSIMGAWTSYGNPCKGKDADLTFHSQSTYILPVEGKKDAFIFMADRWTPQKPSDGRYIWLPLHFDGEGLPYLKWKNEWNLSIFDKN
ncbi:MAG: glycoside hydrolase family 43 protein [Dysgonomonas sp.]